MEERPMHVLIRSFRIKLALCVVVLVLVDHQGYAQDPRRAFLAAYKPHAAAIAEAYTNVSGNFKLEEFTNEGRLFHVVEKKFRFNFRNQEL